MTRIVLFLTLAFVLSGCNQNEFPAWSQRMSELRLELLAQAEQEPYRASQQQVIGSYFGKLTEMVYSLQTDSSRARQFSEAMSKADLRVECGKIFITAQKWRAISQHCTKGSFFICAEEARAYPGAVAAFRSALNVQQRAHFDQEESCRSAL